MNKSSEVGINAAKKWDNTTQEDSHLERLVLLMNTAFPLSLENTIIHTGSIGLNNWIVENIIDIQFEQQFVKKYLRKKTNVEPTTLVKICTWIKQYLEDCSRYCKVALAQLTKDHLTNEDVVTTVFYQRSGWVEKYYIKEFTLFLMPFQKLNLIVRNSGKIPFNHPILTKYKDDLYKKGTKKKSIANVISQLSRFFKWSAANLVVFKEYMADELPIWKFTKEHIKQYQLFLGRQIREGLISANSAKQHVVYIRSFFTYVYENQLITLDVTRGLPRIQANPYKYREIPTTQELQKLFDAVCQYAEDPISEKAAYGLMLFLGMRIEEVITLKRVNINFETKTISFLGKGKQPVKFPIPTILIGFLKNIPNKPVFLFGNPKDFRRRLEGNFKLYKLVAGFPAMEGGVHLLRHTFVTYMSGLCSPRELQKLSRHKSLNTLSYYLHHNDETLLNAVNQIGKQEVAESYDYR